MSEKLSEEEKKLRSELEDHLGVEFLSPDEMEDEVSDAVAGLVAKKEAPRKQQLSPERAVPVSEVIRQCSEQGAKMSRKNPNRFLLYMCATSLNQLTDRLFAAEQEIIRLKGKYEPT